MTRRPITPPQFRRDKIIDRTCSITVCIENASLDKDERQAVKNDGTDPTERYRLIIERFKLDFLEYLKSLDEIPLGEIGFTNETVCTQTLTPKVTIYWTKPNSVADAIELEKCITVNARAKGAVLEDGAFTHVGY